MFDQFAVEGEEAGNDVGFRHRGGEAVGSHHGPVVLAVRFQQFGPEQLALALLVALILPALGKTISGCGYPFLGLVHNGCRV